MDDFVNPTRRLHQTFRSIQISQRPLRTQQLELLDALLAQSLSGDRHPAPPEDNGPPGVAPDEVPGQINPGL